ncbi:three-Cys-motif partner protein TcmP [Elusimicrobiota bacterium]
MPKKNVSQEDIVGRWSVAKLDLLKKYLAAYVNILSKQSWCKGYEYIDAFAGAGKAKTREEQKYVDGSPRIALGLKPSFTRYHFIEQSDWRISQLQKLRVEYSERNIAVYQGDCNKVLTEQILPQLSRASNKRAIAFIDPYGMDVEWETIKALAKAGTVEILLNFPTMAINRGILRQRPEAISQENKDRMARFWGTGDWMADIYKEEQTLFEIERIKIRDSGIELGNRFKKRLRELFPHCTTPVLMTNSKNAPLYCIMFAGHNITGAKIARDIFERYLKLRMGS